MFKHVVSLKDENVPTFTQKNLWKLTGEIKHNISQRCHDHIGTIIRFRWKLKNELKFFKETWNR